MGRLYQLSHPSSRNIQYERAERMEETEDGEDGCEMLSSGHNIAVVHLVAVVTFAMIKPFFSVEWGMGSQGPHHNCGDICILRPRR